MLHSLKEILFIANKYKSKELKILIGLMLLLCFIEIIGIGSIFPLLTLVLNNKEKIEIFNNYLEISINQIIFIAIFFGLLANFSTVYLIYKSNKFSFSLWERFSESVMSAYVNKPDYFYLKNNKSEIIKKINLDCQFFGQYVVLPLMTVCTKLIVIISVLTLLLIVNYKLTISLFILLIVIYYIFNRIFSTSTIQTAEKSRDLFTEAVKVSTEILNSSIEIKNAKTEKFFISKYKNILEQIVPLETHINTIGNIPRYFFESIIILIILLFYVLSLLTGFSLIEYIPTIGLFAIAGYRILPLVSHILFSLYTFKSRVPNIIPLINELKIETNYRFEIIENKNILEIKDANFSYDDKKILNNVNFELKKGEFLRLCGKSGSGKSTLIKIILREYPLLHGCLRLDKNIKIGYVSQFAMIMDTTIQNNITYGSDNILIEKLRLVENICGINKNDFNFSSNLGFMGSNLSGGQRQRISIARALYLEPNLLILDEATSSLDMKSESEILHNIEKLNISLILISHNEQISDQKFKKYYLS